MDVSAVTALEHDLFGLDAWSPAAVAEVVADPGRDTLVAVLEVVAGYAVSRPAGDVADLERIAVAPAHRRSGVASDLLDQVRVQADRAGAVRMLLEVSATNAGALSFYAAHGFTEIDRRRRYYRDGSDALVLEAALGERSGG